MRIFRFIILFLISGTFSCSMREAKAPPNILFVISDDQSFPHASAYGSGFVNTPAFDRVASEGILFENCFAASPSCSPSRASILTGRNIWQLEEAGTHISYFPRKYTSFTELLKDRGYHVGYTGKPWGPGNWEDAGWDSNPVGDSYWKHKLEPPTKGISQCDYVENFKHFLGKRDETQPFFFWCGIIEPHRGYEYESGQKSGKSLEDVDVPGYLYDDERTRNDLLDYALEIEWFDFQLSQMLSHLEEIGELDNTLIVVTSDNGMPFPRAKIQCYESGVHVPLAIRWGDQIAPGRVVSDFIGFNDFAPTFLDLAQIRDSLPEMSGSSFKELLLSEKSGRVDENRSFVLAGKERHNYARPDNLGYPIRVLRTDNYLYIRNLKPDRWPAGNPDLYKDGELGKPAGESILEKKDEDSVANRLFHLLVDKRPAEELYDIVNDPDCLHNIAGEDNEHILSKLRITLEKELIAQGDPRVLGSGNVFDSYPTFKPNRLFDDDGNPLFPGFAEYGTYNYKLID